MVNFNLQDGYSVLEIPKISHNHHHHHFHHQDEDDDDIKIPPLLDSHNSIQDEHRLDGELPTATTTSVLLVQGVQFKHAGNYTCAPSNTRPTHINVHVLKGKHTIKPNYVIELNWNDVLLSSSRLNGIKIIACLIIASCVASGVIHHIFLFSSSQVTNLRQ
jgi:hypothetical protein